LVGAVAVLEGSEFDDDVGFEVEFDSDPDCKVLVVECALELSLEHKTEKGDAS
jgi:hypothetical protein